MEGSVEEDNLALPADLGNVRLAKRAGLHYPLA